MSHSGRREAYMEIVFSIADHEPPLQPMEIAKRGLALKATLYPHNTQPNDWFLQNVYNAMKKRGTKIRKMFKKVPTCDGRASCYPPALWKATFNVETLGLTRFKQVQATAKTIAGELVKTRRRKR